MNAGMLVMKPLTGAELDAFLQSIDLAALAMM